MTISTDYLKIHSHKTSNVFTPLWNLLKDCIFLKSIRISTDYLYKNRQYSTMTRFLTKADQTPSHQIQKDYYNFMDDLTNDNPGLQPCRIVISVNFKSSSNQWKRFTIDLGKQITYDLEFLDREVIEL